MADLVDDLEDLPDLKSDLMDDMGDMCDMPDPDDDFCVDNQYNIWDDFNGNLSRHERIMCNMIIEKVLKIMNIDIKDSIKPFKKFISGESNYLELYRPLIFSHMVEKSNKKKDKAKKISAADKIRSDNLTKKIIAEIDMINNLMIKPDYDIMINKLSGTKYIESIICIFILMIRYVLANRESLRTRDVYELIIGCNKFLEFYKKKENTVQNALNPLCSDNISRIYIDDLEKELNHIIQAYPYNARDVFINYPDLQYDTRFDNLIPYDSLDLKITQEKVIRSVIDGIDKDTGFLIYDRSPVGSGKTTIAAIGIPTALRYLKSSKDKKKILVYTCSTFQVIKNVGRLAISSGIGIGLCIPVKNTYNILYHKSVLNGSVPCTLILALNNMVHLISGDSYIFYTDELTGNIYNNIHKLNNPSKYEIFASASLPELKKIGPIVDRFKYLHSTAIITEIISIDIKIGCNVKQYDGTDYYPHASAKTSDDICKIIGLLEINPFIRRMYEQSTLCKLYDQMIKYIDTKTMPSLDEFLKSPTINMNHIIDMTIKLLQILAKQPDNVIENICQYNISEISEYQLQHINKFSDTPEEKYFVPSSDPVVRAKKDFDHLLQIIKKKLHQMYPETSATHYLTVMFNQMIEEKIILDKKKEKELKEIRKSCSKEEAIIMYDMIHDTSDIDIPIFRFPKYFQIGTEAYYKHFKLDTKIKKFRQEIDYSDFNYNIISKVEDDILMLLFCGIGIYSQKIKNKWYNNYVMKLVNDGKLAYLYADTELSYGMNIPITTVIIPMDSMEKKSIQYIFQTMGRVGREGKSVKASAFVSPEQINHMIRFMKYPDAEEFNQEVSEMLRYIRAD
jgi:hypothetical protein